MFDRIRIDHLTALGVAENRANIALKFARAFGAHSRFRSQSSNSATVIAAMGRVPKSREAI